MDWYGIDKVINVIECFVIIGLCSFSVVGVNGSYSCM